MGDLLNADNDIQVTGKVAVTSAASPASPPSPPSQRHPDSPNSSTNGDDSTWFLRRVLQQRSDAADAVNANDSDEEVAPLTPATSPARGLRRARSESDVSESDASDATKKPEAEPQTEAKKSRVENIVSGMRNGPSSASSTSTTPINGCKKRKLYQPQQHGTSATKFTSEGEEEDV